MKKENEGLSKIDHLDRNDLQVQVDSLKRELEEVLQVTEAFEAKLRAALIEELILEQELTALYKEQKKAKKEKRLEQKKKGKNYQEPKGLVSQPDSKKPQTDPQDAKILKKLYREAMLYVHPDKFSIQEDKQDLAHEATTQLIQLYQQGDLGALQAYVNHIMTGDLMTGREVENVVPPHSDPLEHLKRELNQLQSELEIVKNKYTYKVWVTYPEPYNLSSINTQSETIGFNMF